MEMAESDRISRESLGEKVADLLRRKILSGELSQGTRLVEDELAAQIGTSRGPLRHAFGLLAREGLVATSHGRGTYVTGLTAESLRQLYEVRTVLECHAAELASARIDEQQAGELRQLAEAMEAAAREGRQPDYVHADVEIHRRIWKLSGNDHLIRVLEYLINPCFVLIGLKAEHQPALWEVNAARHREMVAAITSGDRIGAARSMREQLQLSLEGTLSSTAAQPG